MNIYFLTGDIRDIGSASFFLASKYEADAMSPSCKPAEVPNSYPKNWITLESTMPIPEKPRWSRELPIRPGNQVYIIKDGKAVKVHPQTDSTAQPKFRD